MPIGVYVRTPENRAINSASKMGHPTSPETRAKMSIAFTGRVQSPETRAKLSVARTGKPLSARTREKMSMARMGNKNCLGFVASPETCAKNSATHWKGGRTVAIRKQNAKRRSLGLISLNSSFPGCEGHHVDNEQVIYMPKALHRSIYHRQRDGRGMAKINAIAYNFLFKQEVETAMRRL